MNTKSQPISPLKAAANVLGDAVKTYCETAAKLNADPTAIAWALGDEFGAFRFYCAERAARLRNLREAQAQQR
jgi:hypothetical protein